VLIAALVAQACTSGSRATASSAVAPKADTTDAVDAVIRDVMARKDIPGLSLLVARDGVVVKRAGYGLADVERGIPVDAHTAFEIASMSKAFTDAAVLLLAEEGKLSIDDPVSRWIPEAPATWKRITLRMLMNHTSGIPEDWRLHAWDEVPPFFLENTSDAEFMRAAFATPLDFEPGTRSRYSHGPFFLGVVIARASGIPYARFMEERVFRPLGLAATHVNDPSVEVSGRAAGYVVHDGALRSGHPISAAALARGDVGIVTTVDDLFAWYTKLRKGELIHAASLNEMFTPARVANGGVTTWALGWFVAPLRAYPSIGHHGGFRTGFSSVILELPTRHLLVIALTNRANSNPGGIAQRVLACYEPELSPISERATNARPDRERIARFGRVLASIQKGEIDRELMSETFPIEDVDADVREMIPHIESVDDLGSDDISSRSARPFGAHVRELCYCRLRGKETAYTAFALDDEGKVAYLEPFEEE
jgi:CubicO group peptidase (beta-lactamase class C family)